MSFTREEQLTVARWRGLKPHVLLEFNALDQKAIDAGRCRFIELRRCLIPDRLRCIELREQHGLTIFEKLRDGVHNPGTAEGSVQG